MSPVIAHQFAAQCIVCTSACCAILRDSALSNEVAFSFRLSLSFWEGKACFVCGLKFVYKAEWAGAAHEFGSTLTLFIIILAPRILSYI
jgi:hypothetical protein